MFRKADTRWTVLDVLGASPPPVPAAWRANSRGDVFVAHFQIHQEGAGNLKVPESDGPRCLDQKKWEALRHSSVCGY